MSLRRLALVAALLTAAAFLLLGTRRASNTRDWALDHSRQPWAERDGRLVRVHDVRDFRYLSGRTVDRRWVDRTYDLDRLDSVWYVLVPLSERWRGPAHSFVSFGFGDSVYVSISIEARRERDEQYSVFNGLLRQYELIYVIGEERDLIGRRVFLDRSPVYLYPIAAPPTAIEALFLGMLQRATELRESPEFYNTLTNNCTSRLVDHVNLVAPGRIPHGIATILPGYSDEVAQSLGLLTDSSDRAELHRRYRINDRANPASAPAEFSKGIREAP